MYLIHLLGVRRLRGADVNNRSGAGAVLDLVLGQVDVDERGRDRRVASGEVRASAVYNRYLKMKIKIIENK